MNCTTDVCNVHNLIFYIVFYIDMSKCPSSQFPIILLKIFFKIDFAFTLIAILSLMYFYFVAVFVRDILRKFNHFTNIVKVVICNDL